MGKALLQIFTSPVCPYCPAALQLVKELGKEREDVDVKEHNLMTEEGRRLALAYNITSTPTILVSGHGQNEILGYRSPSKRDLIEAIEIVHGRKELPKPKGVFQSLKELFR